MQAIARRRRTVYTPLAVTCVGQVPTQLHAKSVHLGKLRAKRNGGMHTRCAQCRIGACLNPVQRCRHAFHPNNEFPECAPWVVAASQVLPNANSATHRTDVAKVCAIGRIHVRVLRLIHRGVRESETHDPGATGDVLARKVDLHGKPSTAAAGKSLAYELVTVVL